MAELEAVVVDVVVVDVDVVVVVVAAPLPLPSALLTPPSDEAPLLLLFRRRAWASDVGRLRPTFGSEPSGVFSCPTTEAVVRAGDATPTDRDECEFLCGEPSPTLSWPPTPNADGAPPPKSEPLPPITPATPPLNAEPGIAMGGLCEGKGRSPAPRKTLAPGEPGTSFPTPKLAPESALAVAPRGGAASGDDLTAPPDLPLDTESCESTEVLCISAEIEERVAHSRDACRPRARWRHVSLRRCWIHSKLSPTVTQSRSRNPPAYVLPHVICYSLNARKRASGSCVVGGDLQSRSRARKSAKLAGEVETGEREFAG